MENEISLGESTDRRNTGKRYDKKSSRNYGMLFDRDVFTVKDVAERLGINQSVILTAIKKDKLKASRIGGPAGFRIFQADLVSWLESLA